MTTVYQVLRYTALLLVAYAIGVGFVFLLVVDPDLVDIVSALKIVSLFVLIYANREIPHTIEIARHTDLLHLNQIIILLSSVIAIMLIIKTVVQDYSLLLLPATGAYLLSFFIANSYWIATLPIFLYCLLDAYIAFVRNSPESDRRVALEFILFRDLVCAVPLALVLILTEAFLLFGPEAMHRDYAELFFSGAIAVIQLSSAISSRALDVLQTRQRGPVLLRREAVV
jgi:hypothetical protein